MPLPEPTLDDLRFQRDLVDEARRRIIRYCPEWTDYNLSDPGITLIELFAWMTELIVYRLNRVPEKNYIKFMDLLGIQLQPASSARTEMTFRLSTPFPISPEEDDTVAVVSQGTEVATRRTDEEAEITFTTDEKLTITPPKLAELRRADDFNKNYVPRMGIEIFQAFSRAPAEGDMFYVGFDPTQNLSGHILQLAFICEETQATGVRREDPPLVWEVSVGGGKWEEVSLSTRSGEKDTTGGLNNPEGSLVLYLPLTMKTDAVQGRNADWVRCRIQQRRKDQGMYSQSPRITRVVAQTLGATTWATHAIIVRDEFLGKSNGEPGQIFTLANRPLLALRPGETVEIEEKREGEIVFIPWTLVLDFSASDRHDRHFGLDTATGEVLFGPSVRQADGTVRQYGRVPEAGRQIRFTQYRYGGGMVGNVPVGKIQVLKSSIPYIDRVINLRRAEGGRDAESLDEAKLRARREVRSQQRAVTGEDFEYLAKKANRQIARVKCNTAGVATGAIPPGTVELLLVPAVASSLREGDLTKLVVPVEFTRDVTAFLDDYRLLTTTLRIREPNYVGLKVDVEIVVSEYSQPDVVRARVADRLREFLSPLALAAPDETPDELLGPNWEGWPFGRKLYISELYSIVQKVPGVKHVRDVRLSQRRVIPAREVAPDAPDDVREQALQSQSPLIAVTTRMLDIPEDTVVVSLAHDVQVVEL